MNTAEGAFNEVVSTLHDLDRRIAVVETRQEAQEGDLDRMRCAMDEMRQEIRANTDLLRTHDKEETAQRHRMTQYVIATLITALLSGATMLFTFILNRVTS